jgi:hypothetical protein
MKILLSVPNTGWNHKFVTMACVRLCLDARYQVQLIMPTHKPYEHSMNRIAFDFLNSDFDYWLSIDADNPPKRNPLDLVEFDLDVIGFPTPVFNNAEGGWPLYWNALDKAPDGYKPHNPDPGKLVEVDAVGSGCIMVHRRVIEGTKAPRFVRETDENGFVIQGPDFYFCDRVREAGFHVWTHYGYPCQHFNELELTEAMESFSSPVRPAPQT